ncbi:MAG: YdcF family protein [Bacteroidetes bacterium]|nr:YdcF family protein [Bacteroidota bacterium]
MKGRAKSILRIFKILFLSFGIFFILLCSLAFTTIPYYAWHWLGVNKGCIEKEPAVVVLLGGSGMPSGDGLIRSYYTAMIGKEYPKSIIIIALPGDTTDSTSSISLLRYELLLRGIDKNRISLECTGHNTRQQAMQIAGSIGKTHFLKPMALVTSPENMYRSILSFQKVGFTDVKGLPTFETSVNENNLYFRDKDLKGNPFVPPIGQSKQLRYQFWNHLKYEILVFRELFAIGYYKLRAWI